MKVLVVGGGGREHAMAWSIARSPRVQKVFVAPGNGGTALEPDLVNLPITDINTLAAFAEHEGIGLTVVGPEAPLAAGIVDVFRAKGLRIFGPSKLAAQLESSKEFAKQFMVRHGIPTGKYQSFTDPALAHEYINLQDIPIVVKADGLAAGKGVVVATTRQEAHDAVDAMLVDNRMGSAGARVVIEEFLHGEEASFIVMVDGKNILALASSQDHKRLLDGDQGPNTGGMGAYSPAPVVTPSVHARVLREIIGPTVAGMAKDGLPYTGFLYAGLMIDKSGQAKTLEFNCRLGDPETQPIFARLKSDFTLALDAAIDGRLDQVELTWDRRTALGVVLASEHYPGEPVTGDLIHGLLPRGNHGAEELMVFHAGTQSSAGGIVTSGGRVLCVTALGDSVKMAQLAAYRAINGEAGQAPIHFRGMQYRHDIGHQAIGRKRGA